METKMMKKSKISLWKWALGICMLFAGVQSAWALKCNGTIYFRLPTGWTEAYVFGDGQFTKGTEKDGWIVFNAATSAAATAEKFYISGTGGYNPNLWFNRESLPLRVSWIRIPVI